MLYAIILEILAKKNPEYSADLLHKNSCRTLQPGKAAPGSEIKTN